MNRDDIVGHKIVRALHESKLDGDLDISTTYLKLDSGRVLFFASSVADDIEEEKIPLTAKRLKRPIRKKLEGRMISQIFRRMDGEERDGDSIILELDSDIYATECHVAPLGTGQAGLYFYSEQEFTKLLGTTTQPF